MPKNPKNKRMENIAKYKQGENPASHKRGKESPIFGRRYSLEHRRKMSITHKRIGTKPPPPLGIKMSEEQKRKISEAKKGTIPSLAARKKMSETRILRGIAKGSNNPSWRGGISFEPGYMSFLNKKRRILELGADGSHNFGEWENLKAQYNWTCPACKRKEPEIKLTEDHIVPLIKGGSDNIENIQPLCKSCNSKKNTKTIKYENV